MWKGCAPTVMRAVVLNAAQLSTYAQGKQLLLKTPYFVDGTTTHLVASLISGFISTAVSIPIDMSKTRIQTMKNNEYKNAMDVIVKVVKNEGPLALWKGFTPYFLRLGPHTVVRFIFQISLTASLHLSFMKRWRNSINKETIKSKKKSLVTRNCGFSRVLSSMLFGKPKMRYSL